MRAVSDDARCVAVAVFHSRHWRVSINIDVLYVLIVAANTSVLIFQAALQGNISQR
jgi:uncharacterized membrane protein YagU involved in acid resistance